MLFMQLLQQQLLSNPEGREAMLAYQAGIRQGVLGGGAASSSGSMQMQRMAQQLSQEEGQNIRQGFDQNMLNPMQQAYMQYALHAQQAQQKSVSGMQPQQQMKMGMMGKDQDLHMGNTRMQDTLEFQAANQGQISFSKKPPDPFGHGGKQVMEESHQAVSNQSHIQNQNQNQKHPAIPTSFGQSMQGNAIRPMQTPQAPQTIHNTGNSQVAMAAQLQAMQALALERNIDLSHPQNANLMAQLMQSRMLGQQKVNESNMNSQSKQPVTSPQNANESSPRSDVSGHSGSTKTRQTVSPGHLGSTSNTTSVNSASGGQGQQFSMHGRENQLPPRQPTVNSSGMSSMPPPQLPANMSQGADHFGKNMLNGSESLQIQHARPQMNRSSPQSAASSNDVGLANSSHKVQKPPPGFTKLQLHVLKAQILAFRRIKVFANLFSYLLFLTTFWALLFLLFVDLSI